MSNLPADLFLWWITLGLLGNIPAAWAWEVIRDIDGVAEDGNDPFLLAQIGAGPEDAAIGHAVIFVANPLLGPLGLINGLVWAYLRHRTAHFYEGKE